MPLSADRVKSLCAELLQAEVEDIEFPGGSSRESIRVTIAGQKLIVTHRKNLQRAHLESTTLRILNQSHSAVPHLIACRDNYLIQQDVGEQRLSERINSSDSRETSALLEAALSSLHAIQDAGKSSRSLQSLVVLGNKPEWLEKFIGSPQRLGDALQLPAPSLDRDKLVALLTVNNPCFIKWDARPGNAVVHDSGTVFWIDWEHCGRRHPLDDVAWLLADEYTPYSAANEDALIAKILPSFANGYSLPEAHEYLRVFGSFHSCIRLAMILRYQARDGWWDYAKCLQYDRVGVVPELAARVAARAAGWARFSDLTTPLSPWFEAVQHKLASL